LYFARFALPLQSESSVPACRWPQGERKVRAAEGILLLKLEAVGDGRSVAEENNRPWLYRRGENSFLLTGKGEKVG